MHLHSAYCCVQANACIPVWLASYTGIHGLCSSLYLVRPTELKLLQGYSYNNCLALCPYLFDRQMFSSVLYCLYSTLFIDNDAGTYVITKLSKLSKDELCEKLYVHTTSESLLMLCAKKYTIIFVYNKKSTIKYKFKMSTITKWTIFRHSVQGNLA